MSHQQLQQHHPAPQPVRSGDRFSQQQQRHQGIPQGQGVPADAAFQGVFMGHSLYRHKMEQPGPVTGGGIPNAADSPAANVASPAVMHPSYHPAAQFPNQSGGAIYSNRILSRGAIALPGHAQATNSKASRSPIDDENSEGSQWTANFLKALTEIDEQGSKSANSAAAESSKPASLHTKRGVESQTMSPFVPEKPDQAPSNEVPVQRELSQDAGDVFVRQFESQVGKPTMPVQGSVVKSSNLLKPEERENLLQQKEIKSKNLVGMEQEAKEARRIADETKKASAKAVSMKSSGSSLDTLRKQDRESLQEVKAISNKGAFNSGPSNFSSQQNSSTTRVKSAGAPPARPIREASSAFPSQKIIYEVAQLLALKEDNKAAPEGFSKMEISSIQGRNNLQHGKQGSFRGGDGPIRLGSGPVWGSHGATSGNSGMNTNLTVNLPKAKNAWVRGAKVDPVTEAIQVTNGVLNKLTSDNYDKMLEQMTAIKITSFKVLKEIANCIYEKATLEPRFCQLYARLTADLCKQYELISGVSSSNRKEDSQGWDFITVKKKDDGMFYWSADGEDYGPFDNEAKAKKMSVTKTRFRVLIVQKCEHVFKEESGTIGEATALLEAAKQEFREAEKSGTVEEEALDKIRSKVADLHYKEVKVKRKRIGNVQFSGELFKRGLLKQNAMQDGVERLILFAEPCSSVPSNEDIELTCKLLSTIGLELENSTRKSQGVKGMLDPKALMDKYISRMKSWKNLEPRIRFMIADLVDLRLRGWKEASAATTVKSQAQSVSADRQSSNRQGSRQNYSQHNSQSSSIKGNLKPSVAIAENKPMVERSYVIKGRNRSAPTQSTEKSNQPMNSLKYLLASNKSNMFGMTTGMVRDSSNKVFITKNNAVPEKSKEDIENGVKDLRTSLKDAIDLGENEKSLEYMKLENISHAVKAQFLSKVVEDIFNGEKKFNMFPSAMVRAGVLSNQFNLQDLIDSMESQLKKMYDLMCDAPMMPAYISEFVCKLIPDVFKITEFWKILERVFSASEKENYSALARLCVEFLKQKSKADVAKIESDFNLAEVNFLLKNEECSALMKDLAKEEVTLEWFFRKL